MEQVLKFGADTAYRFRCSKPQKFVKSITFVVLIFSICNIHLVSQEEFIFY
jgi:hypothetical protein